GAEGRRIVFFLFSPPPTPPRHAVRRYGEKPRNDSEAGATERLSFCFTGDAEASDLPKRRRRHCARPAFSAAVSTTRREAQGSRASVYAWRAHPPDDAGLPLHGLLPQRLRGESVLGQPGIRRVVGELPTRRYVRTRVSRGSQRHVARGRGVQRHCGSGAVSAIASAMGRGRIRVVGWSFGRFLTAMGLARNSDLFKAGVDFHGVHDWSRSVARQYGARLDRYEKGDLSQAMETAFKASPDADIATWTSPVL